MIKYRNIDKMKEYLKRFSFQARFVYKKFYSFTSSEMINITKIWRNK